MKGNFYAITFGDKKFKDSRIRAINSLKKITDNTYLFTEEDLKEYKEKYPKIIYPNATGGGFWIFKSIFLKKVMEEMKYGDMIMWMDAGVECFPKLKKYLSIFYEIAEDNEGFCIFNTIHPHTKYTKRDCFYYMGCDKPEFYNKPICDAAIQIYIKNDKTIKFIGDYLKYNADYRIATDSPNECGLPNFNNFVAHRHDQSILTNLTLKYGISRFIEPTQFYIKDWSEKNCKTLLSEYELKQSRKYKVLFNHHRIRK
tara:strand:- start:900 stop:1667 length:768 start_codon:yes stop_codon:yes gene_type:complete